MATFFPWGDTALERESEYGKIDFVLGCRISQLKGTSTMSAIVTVEEAQANLKELIHRLAPGEEVVITENQKPVAKLVSEPPMLQPKPRPGPGLGKGMITFIAPDFNGPLEDMKEYME